jgi:hypothetical protein
LLHVKTPSNFPLWVIAVSCSTQAHWSALCGMVVNNSQYPHFASKNELSRGAVPRMREVFQELRVAPTLTLQVLPVPTLNSNTNRRVVMKDEEVIVILGPDDAISV